MYEQNKTITKQKGEINALKNTIQKQDSINAVQYDDLFNSQAELGRYQMALEILKDGEDKKAAQTFEHVLTTQTE
jgi:TolA-binding protein